MRRPGRVDVVQFGNSSHVVDYGYHRPAEHGRVSTKTGQLQTGPVDCFLVPRGSGTQQCYATYTYTPNGRPATVADANGNLTTYGYDGHGRLSKTNFPSKTTAGVSSATDFEEFRYEPGGNITGKHTRKGDWILSAFDDLGQHVRKLPQSGGNCSAISPVCGASGSEVCTEYDLSGHGGK